jgi:hypothetical protein
MVDLGATRAVWGNGAAHSRATTYFFPQTPRQLRKKFSFALLAGLILTIQTFLSNILARYPITTTVQP